MYMSTTLTRASLINILLLNPLLTTATATTTARFTTTTTPRLHHLQPNLPTHPHCSAINLYNHYSNTYSTMSTSQDHHHQQQQQQPSTNQTQPQDQTQEQPQTESQKSEYLALPSAESATKLDVSGDGSTVKLDHLGPVVVNQDGTLSRISNWEQMTEIERRNTLRVLGKRNKMRLDALKSKGEGEGKGDN
ncbi:uncharacterized protein BO80DRAFT_78989 [Aspergillus ibericus CBS 121593]|uniref:Fungal specific transcription factor n=1 Tax=Aspergillus ibericus CBS 121593 TaxID=1448316 RepID=A0A395HHJ5_9EURO|nr:hypothetical protein BO80DRAFT_78989 [Aspergillus ibericus CBS 121593]RAL05714.1 hypothetical protein BO80DRAFT_78989 [Aspergillus ibericus CBS 121593]